MTLRAKTFLVSSIIAAIVLAIFLFISKIQLLDTFYEAERKDVYQNIRGALGLFEQTLEDFKIRYKDWSNWDDAYEFVQNNNPEFIHSNLNDESMVNLPMNLLIFADTSG